MRIIQEEISSIVVADCVVLNNTDFSPFLEMRNEKTYLKTVKERS